MAKKRNPQDATLRNIRALQKRLARMEFETVSEAVDKLLTWLPMLERRVERLERTKK